MKKLLIVLLLPAGPRLFEIDNVSCGSHAGGNFVSGEAAIKQLSVVLVSFPHSPIGGHNAIIFFDALALAQSFFTVFVIIETHSRQLIPLAIFGAPINPDEGRAVY